ncbi:MAG: hypothetical protein R2764_08800 [Bacteroidales bacterium]
MKYNDVVLANPENKLTNGFNKVEYNVVYMDGASSRLMGNFIADSVIIPETVDA